MPTAVLVLRVTVMTNGRVGSVMLRSSDILAPMKMVGPNEKATSILSVTGRPRCLQVNRMFGVLGIYATPVTPRGPVEEFGSGTLASRSRRRGLHPRYPRPTARFFHTL